MRVLLATVIAFSLVALAAASAGAAPALNAKLTAPEEKWVTPVVTLWNTMNARLMVVGKQTTTDQALVPGTKANGALIETLGDFVTCSKAMTKAKTPPSARLKPFAATMKSACALLGTGAHGVANGISTIYKKNNGKLGALQIQAGFKYFQQGSSKLAAAHKQLLAVGGKNIFGA